MTHRTLQKYYHCHKTDFNLSLWISQAIKNPKTVFLAKLCGFKGAQTLNFALNQIINRDYLFWCIFFPNKGESMKIWQISSVPPTPTVSLPNTQIHFLQPLNIIQSLRFLDGIISISIRTRTWAVPTQNSYSKFHPYRCETH